METEGDEEYSTTGSAVCSIGIWQGVFDLLQKKH